jgi:diaminopimelate epimerase
VLIEFHKFHAQSNDFIFLDKQDVFKSNIDLAEMATEMCQRHSGIGADGLVVLYKHPTADARMIIHNSDGSRAAMCGSALRCCALLLYIQTKKKTLRIETDSGLKIAIVNHENDEITVKVFLGKPEFLEEELALDGITGSLVNVGNEHFVYFVEEIDESSYRQAKKFQEDPRFPDGVNVEFVQIFDRGMIRMGVFERGVGITMACGTGAVASVFTSIQKGLLDNEVQVLMPGGYVTVSRLDDGEFTLAGEAEFVFSGEFEWIT